MLFSLVPTLNKSVLVQVFRLGKLPTNIELHLGRARCAYRVPIVRVVWLWQSKIMPTAFESRTYSFHRTVTEHGDNNIPNTSSLVLTTIRTRTSAGKIIKKNTLEVFQRSTIFISITHFLNVAKTRCVTLVGNIFRGAINSVRVFSFYITNFNLLRHCFSKMHLVLARPWTAAIVCV